MALSPEAAPSARKGSAVQMNGYRTLEEGRRVEFDVGPGKKGEEAQNVRVT